MRRYSVVIAQKENESVDITHIQLYGRSKYEAIGYAVKHRIIHSGELIFINAFNCDCLPEKSNIDMILSEDKNNDPTTATIRH
jgi:hypothetical protein